MVARRNENVYDEETSIRKWIVLLGAFFNNVLIWGLAWGGGVFQVRGYRTKKMEDEEVQVLGGFHGRIRCARTGRCGLVRAYFDLGVDVFDR